MKNSDILAILPKAKQFEMKIGDGLILVIYPSGTKTFFARKKWKGKDHKYKIGDFPEFQIESAQRRAKSIIDELMEKGKVEQRKLIIDVVDKYIKEYIATKKPATIKAYESIIRNNFQSIGQLPYDAGPELIRSEFLKIKAKYSANRTLDLIRGAFRYSFLDDPTAMIKRHKEEQRERMLTNEEQDRLVEIIRNDGMPQGSKDLILFLVLSGFRKSEGINLKWNMVDLENNIICLKDSKTGKSYRRISMHCANHLKKLHGRDGYVFRNADGNKFTNSIDQTWRRICDDNGFDGLRLHDLRHSFASRLVNNGATLFQAAGALGHKSIKSTARYAHLEHSSLGSVLDACAPKLS